MVTNMTEDIIKRMIDAGHTPTLDENGNPDMSITLGEFHNGPMCSVCGESRCEHCDNGDPFDPCPGKEKIELDTKERRRKQYLELKKEFENEETIEQKDNM